jgi:NTP pyrophosphatase (non-canonical NTP hydrolase)
MIVPLLGLAGEVGSLLTEYKKHLRDGTAYRIFREQIAEDLGDLLWYVASVASRFAFDLDEIARQNLEKTRERWPAEGTRRFELYDDGFPEREQFPRQIRIKLVESRDGERAEVRCIWEGQQIGNVVTDNAYEDDGYRFHDVFHISYAVMLGWSPILRKLMDRKRRSSPDMDHIEDGGRATVIEELIAALVFNYARKHSYLDGVGSLDYHLLKTIRELVSGREVASRSLFEWEQAILAGYRVWRLVRANGGGAVIGDLPARTLTYERDG